MTRNPSLLLFPSLLMLSAPGAVRGAAANERVDQAEPIEEIIIEAEREHTVLNEASHSIAVFTEDQLDRGTDRNMRDLLRRVPNVTTDPRAGLVIRGIAQNGIRRNGVAGSTQTSVKYADGAYTPSDQDLWDAVQVAVARGPESYLGAGYMGGISNVTYNKPNEIPEGRITTAWAPENEERELGLVYGAPLSETLSYRVAAHLRAADGTLNNVTRDDDAWKTYDQRLLRVQSAWRPDDHDTDINLTFERQENRLRGTDSINGGADVDPFDRDTFANAATADNETTTTGRVEVRHRFDERWSTILRSYFIRGESSGHGDCDDTADASCRSRYENKRDYAVLAARLFFESGPWFAFFRQSVFHLDVSHFYGGPIFAIDFLDPDDTVPGVEAALEFKQPIADWWVFATQAGVRRQLGRLGLAASLIRSGQKQDGAEQTRKAYRIGSTGDPEIDADYDSAIAAIFPKTHFSEDLDEYQYLPTFVADYALTDELSIGAKFERAFRGGGVWFNAARGTVSTYDDEFADSYDLFLRSTWLDGRLNVRVNAFHTEIRDQQVFVDLSSTPDDTDMLNAKRSHNEGIELETAWTDGSWNAWFSGGLLHAEFDDIELIGVNYSGNDFPNAPDWTIAAGFTFGASRGPFIAMDAAIRPETTATLDNIPGVVNERRAIVNARVGWAFEQVELSLFARNLLDDNYLEYHDPGEGVNPVYIVGEPRVVGGSLSLSL